MSPRVYRLISDFASRALFGAVKFGGIKYIGGLAGRTMWRGKFRGLKFKVLKRECEGGGMGAGAAGVPFSRGPGGGPRIPAYIAPRKASGSVEQWL